MPLPSFTGSLVGIAVAPRAAAEMTAVEAIAALTGRGLEGDRYAATGGSFPRRPGDAPQDITLIEEEALEAALRDQGVAITHLMTRRNLLTRGVPLNHLVGREFLVGEALLRGCELSEPCRHLQKLTCPEILKPLIHRGGLRAEIIRGGLLRVGDVIRPAA